MFRIFRVPCMSMPIRHLPVFQNWDCHVCGSCCKEYVVAITPEERARIEAQSWEGDEVVGGRPLFRKIGRFWSRKIHSIIERMEVVCS